MSSGAAPAVHKRRASQQRAAAAQLAVRVGIADDTQSSLHLREMAPRTMFQGGCRGVRRWRERHRRSLANPGPSTLPAACGLITRNDPAPRSFDASKNQDTYIQSVGQTVRARRVRSRTVFRPTLGRVHDDVASSLRDAHRRKPILGANDMASALPPFVALVGLIATAVPLLRALWLSARRAPRSAEKAG
jgi:hypothetical protein